MALQPSPFRSILVPLDGSPLAEQALPLAADLAGRAGAKLRLALVHRVPPAPLDPASARMFTAMELATRKSERSYLRALQTRLREGGTRLSSAVTLTGAVGQTLTGYVRELGLDLVVMATHGRGGLRRAWLGSVADHLVRSLEVPVLLVRPSDGGRPAKAPAVERILVPLDGSSLAEEALETAAELARLWQAEVSLLQVVSPVVTVPDPMFAAPSAYDQDMTALCLKQAEEYLDDLVGELRAKGLRASCAAMVGWSAAETILTAARPERASLIVLASHGRTGLSRLALGSVADKLIRGSDVPVLVRRPAGRRTKGRARDRKASGGR
jgi:nucleotide-binding universal stress UspA family protein